MGPHLFGVNIQANIHRQKTGDRRHSKTKKPKTRLLTPSKGFLISVWRALPVLYKQDSPIEPPKIVSVYIFIWLIEGSSFNCMSCLPRIWYIQNNNIWSVGGFLCFFISFFLLFVWSFIWVLVKSMKLNFSEIFNLGIWVQNSEAFILPKRVL